MATCVVGPVVIVEITVVASVVVICAGSATPSPPEVIIYAIRNIDIYVIVVIVGVEV